MKAEKIYLDMDGVLADFDRGVRELCGMDPLPQTGKTDPHQDNLMWEEIRKVGHFYDKLELMPGAKEMFGRIWDRYGDRCEILTGIPKPERGILTAGEDKIRWMRRMLSEDVKINIVQRREKLKSCDGSETVLVDDREDTIRDWVKKGGTGILHASAKESMKKMEELGLL